MSYATNRRLLKPSKLSNRLQEGAHGGTRGSTVP